jgi:pyrrolidone-carboxylate peptidase
MLFLFAFRYRQKPNISEKVLGRLPYRKHILSPPYDAKDLIETIRKERPTIVIGIGQSRAGHLVRVERIARDVLVRHHKTIVKKRKELAATLHLKHVPGTRVSYNAGTYYCNFVLFELLKTFSKSPKIAFLHIPKTLEVHRAEQIVRRVLRSIQ